MIACLDISKQFNEVLHVVGVRFGVVRLLQGIGGVDHFVETESAEADDRDEADGDQHGEANLQQQEEVQDANTVQPRGCAVADGFQSGTTKQLKILCRARERRKPT